MMFGLFKKSPPAPKAPAAAPAHAVIDEKEIWARINQRLPPAVLFRTPPQVIKQHGLNKFKYREDLETWQRVIDRYPNPPSSQIESNRREAHMWDWMMEMMAVDVEGQRSLKPRQFLLDTFEKEEKWIFRYYYAACGTVYKCSQQELSRLFMTVNNIHLEFEKAASGDAKYPDLKSKELGQINGRFEKAIDALKFFENDTYPKHMEKWGEWFVSHIEDAFRKKYETKPETQNIHGDGGFATLADVQKTPAANPWSPRLGAQHQTFKD